jgi:hypothetical protein
VLDPRACLIFYYGVFGVERVPHSQIKTMSIWNYQKQSLLRARNLDPICLPVQCTRVTPKRCATVFALCFCGVVRSLNVTNASQLVPRVAALSPILISTCCAVDYVQEPTISTSYSSSPLLFFLVVPSTSMKVRCFSGDEGEAEGQNGI